MSIKSKRSIVTILASLSVLVVYLIYALGNHAPLSQDLQGWGKVMLIFIGIGIVVEILVHILFHIALSIGIAVKNECTDDKAVEKKVERIVANAMVEDEMEKLISLKSNNVGYICAGAGFIIALVTLTLGSTPIFVLHTLFASFYLGSIISGVVDIFLYEWGVQRG